jgi:putative FmdB family regulatory protein
MPVYEYVCESCGHTTEALRKLSEADTAIACEQCGGNRTRRVHSVFAAATDRAGGQPLPVAPCGRCGDPRGSCAT